MTAKSKSEQSFFCRRRDPSDGYNVSKLRTNPFSSECAARAKDLLQRRHCSPAKLREQPDGGLLDKLVFGVGVGHEVSSLLKSNSFEQIGYLHESVRLNLFRCHLAERRRFFEK